MTGIAERINTIFLLLIILGTMLLIDLLIEYVSKYEPSKVLTIIDYILKFLMATDVIVIAFAITNLWDS